MGRRHRAAAIKGQFVALRKYSKHLAWALPLMEFLFDFVDMQWMFSHEPGLTDEVVMRYQLLLLPGILFFPPLPAILFNSVLAGLIRTVATWLGKFWTPLTPHSA